ncbi:MAG TPA: iron-sulfur cluster assembly scaffold protein [Candidatus Saccharimonadia bacterium]|nr:iron-sulfur cluster assembly scaffold protein [Candidatus Saccharimonadia bacterium]HSJ02284.1 iron-sulfur cluster assembly scaffold protein [Verrucomicrobium sp.]
MLTPEICEAILRDHYRKPRHRGTCEGGPAERVENPACGDVVTVSLALSPSGGGQNTITCARFEGAGCAASQAGASLVLSMVQGMQAPEGALLLERFCQVMESGVADPEKHHEEFGDAGALVSLARFPARVVCATLGARLAIRMLRKPM